MRGIFLRRRQQLANAVCMEAFLRPTQEAPWGCPANPWNSPALGLSGEPLGLSGEPLGLSGEPLGLSGEPLGLSGEPLGLPRALLIGFRLERICRPCPIKVSCWQPRSAPQNSVTHVAFIRSTQEANPGVVGRPWGSRQPLAGDFR